MPAGFGVVPGDEVAFDPGDGHLERLPDLRNDPPADPGANGCDQMRIGQGKIAPALPAIVETLDRPSLRILHEAAFLAAAALEAVDEMAAKLRLENVGKHENWRGRAIAGGLASAAPADPARPSTRAYSSNGATSTTRSIRSRTTQARATPKALARPSPSRRNRIDGYRVSSAAPRSRERFGDDSEEGGFDAFDDAPTGRERLQRSIRLGIAGRAEEGQRDQCGRETN